MYTLFGHNNSGSTAVEIALSMADVEFDYIEAASWVENDALEALARANPLKQIPTLVLPDNSVMTESAAILIHLGLHYPLSGLLPENKMAATQSIRGLVFLAANCYSAISIIDYPGRWLASTEASQSTSALSAGTSSEAILEAVSEIEVLVREGSKKRLYYHWSLFIQSFPASPFLSGVSLGALDVLAAVISRWSGTREYLQQHHSEFHALMQRIECTPECEAVFAKRFS